MNEEEVKIKIVLPFLERLGINASELKLETSFSLKVGRHNVELVAPKTSNGVGARLDILVVRNESNVFIVEVKEADHQLSEVDRDQAISYGCSKHFSRTTR